MGGAFDWARLGGLGAWVIVVLSDLTRVEASICVLGYDLYCTE